MAVSPIKLSGSTNGRGVVVTSITAASGNVLHTTVTGAGASVFDEVYVYAMNLTTVARKVVVNAGGTATGDRIRLTLPSSSGGLFLMVPGLRYNGGVTLRAYATSASKVSMHGYVNRNS